MLKALVNPGVAFEQKKLREILISIFKSHRETLEGQRLLYETRHSDQVEIILSIKKGIADIGYQIDCLEKYTE